MHVDFEGAKDAELLLELLLLLRLLSESELLAGRFAATAGCDGMLTGALSDRGLDVAGGASDGGMMSPAAPRRSYLGRDCFLR